MALGGMTLAEMLGRMSSAEFALWRAYDQIEPFGDERADTRQAITSCLLANRWAGPGRQYKINDFMAVKKKPRIMGWRKMKKLLKAAFGK